MVGWIILNKLLVIRSLKYWIYGYVVVCGIVFGNNGSGLNVVYVCFVSWVLRKVGYVVLCIYVWVVGWLFVVL